MKQKRCPLCEQGVKLIGDEHWIVKSIIPARITVKRCKLAPPTEKKVDKNA